MDIEHIHMITVKSKSIDVKKSPIYTQLVHLEIKGVNDLIALFPTVSQDYLQHKNWISIPFIWLSYHVKAGFKIFHFYDLNVQLLICVLLQTRSFDNVRPFPSQIILLGILVT